MKKVVENIKSKDNHDEKMDIYFQWLQEKKAENIKDDHKAEVTREDLLDGINGRSLKNMVEKEKKIDPLE